MKAYEIENFLEKKIYRESWTSIGYITFDKQRWKDEQGFALADMSILFTTDDWQEYKNPVTMSRYRFQNVTSGETWDDNQYYNEKGQWYKNSDIAPYFADTTHTTTKIGEEIPCPWEQ